MFVAVGTVESLFPYPTFYFLGVWFLPRSLLVFDFTP